MTSYLLQKYNLREMRKLNKHARRENNSLVVIVTILTGRNASNVHIIHIAKDGYLTEGHKL